MRTLLLFLASGLAFPLQIWALQPEKVRAELLELDQIIDRQKSFIDLKLGRIQQLEHLIDSKTDNLDQMYNLQSLLADTYFTYQFDSTLYWLRDNLELATRINDPTRINETRLKIANLYTTAGYYLEAANLLDRQIDTAELAGSVLGRLLHHAAALLQRRRRILHQPRDGP